MMQLRGDALHVTPARRVEGALKVPGDKSISHRALLVGAVGHGPMEIEGCSPADDVRASLDAVRSLGVPVTGLALKSHVRVESKRSSTLDRDFQLLAEGRGWEGLSTPEGTIDVRNSGTTIRVLLGIIAGSPVSATLTGDDSIRGRPMARVVDPLRSMGATITGGDGGSRVPLRVVGGPLHGVRHRLPVASAQVKSALLLAGIRASGRTSVEEPSRSRDHTERLLEYLKVPIERSLDGLIVKSTQIQNDKVLVPGDLSSAAFFLVAAAMLDGSRLEIEDVGTNPTRTGILDALRLFGAEVTVSAEREACGEPRGVVSVRSADRRPLAVAGELTVRSIDELPLIAVLGSAAEGHTEVHDAGELRVKESDRIAVLTRALRAMGARIEEHPDGFTIDGPARMRGARVDPGGDHRIAMALAVAGLAAEGETVIEGWGCVDASHPGFERDLSSVVVP